MVQVIGGFRLLKAVLLFAGAIGALRLLHKDLDTELTHVVRSLNVDSDGHYFRLIADKLWKVQSRLPVLAIAMITYGLLFTVEGVGLLKYRRWAEYLTVIITSSFLPIEIYEMIKHATILKAVTILINAAIVAYLIIRIRKDKKEHA